MKKNLFKTKFWALLVLLAGSSALHLSSAEPVYRPVPVAEVVEASAYQTRFFPGEVRASKRVELAFNVSGQLTELNAFEGSEVGKGTLLARLDQRDFQYRLDAAQASFTQSKLDYDRKLKLFNSEVISKAEIDQVEASFLAVRANLDTAKKAFDDTSLYAPFDAVISKRHIENFEQVVAKDTVVSLQDVSEVEVVVKVPERLMARGDREDLHSIEVKFDADHEIWYEAQLGEFASQANPITKTYDAVVKLPSPEELNTFTGMTASVKVTFSEDDSEAGLLVPVRSIFPGNNGVSYVWVIPAEGGNPVKTEIKTSRPVGEDVLVTEGLQPGQMLAVAGIHSLTEAMEVRPARKHSEGLEQ